VVAHSLANMPLPVSDLRPSRLDIDVLLTGTSLEVTTRRAVIDALEGRALLFGSEAPSIPPDANGRLSTKDLDVALAEFDEQTRTIVKSVLSQVGALA
jgi:hypothetical protein